MSENDIDQFRVRNVFIGRDRLIRTSDGFVIGKVPLHIDYESTKESHEHVTLEEQRTAQSKLANQKPEKTEPLEKPPLGVQPRHLHDSKRLGDILRAMYRYHDANKVISGEWISEAEQLCVSLGAFAGTNEETTRDIVGSVQTESMTFSDPHGSRLHNKN